MKIDALRRYPIKGLPGQSLRAIRADAGGFAFDRVFGLEKNGGADDGEWRRWSNFWVLKNEERLAAIEVDFDSDSESIFVSADGARAGGAINDESARDAIEANLRAWLRCSLRLIRAREPLWDFRGETLTIVNRASVAALSRLLECDLSVDRFRANIVIDGAAAWAEESWRGKTVAVGEARFVIGGGVPRCAATSVNPQTARRDMRLPESMRSALGHVNLGVFARVARGGAIAVGDEARLRPAEESQPR